MPDFNWMHGARESGGAGWPGAPFSEHAECDLDDVSLWNRALSCEEIAALWDEDSIVLEEAPRILSITDVPDDQGGRVYVRFARSSHDTDVLADKAAELYTVERLDGENWVAVGTGVAYGSATYIHEVTTLADSTAVDPALTTFRVVVAMDEGNWASATATGYSVDNLAPGVPQDLSWSQWGVLAWQPVADEDCQYYRVYGSAVAEFAAAGLVLSTATVEATVDPHQHAYWFVTAVDFAGNESVPAELDSASDVADRLPTMVALGNYPNPFNPQTTITYAVPRDGHVQLAIYDAAGRHVRTLVSEVASRGDHRTVWDGSDGSGRSVPSGIYFVRLVAGGEVVSSRMTLVK